MRTLIILPTLLVLLACNNQSLEDNHTDSHTNPVDPIVTEPVPQQAKTNKPPTAIHYFQKEGIWDTLTSLCPAQAETTFHIKNFNKNRLTNIDSTLAGAYIRGIYSLKSVYPIRITPLPNHWKFMVFYGEQYDSDQITKFLGVVSISDDFTEKGQMESLSTWGDFAGESWEYFSEFQSDTAFTLQRVDQTSCEDFEGNRLTGEISELSYAQIFQIRNTGRIEMVRNDTLGIKYCE